MEDDIKFDLVQMIGSKLDILDQEIIYMNISTNQGTFKDNFLFRSFKCQTNFAGWKRNFKQL